ncbi:MAG: hypothetical protein QOE92_1357 [Chloroflexota bacterium]|jgi:hypothetical protein|nr:hypothetical protein [Chloroflexota bacterium]
MGRRRFEYSADTTVSPERFVAALTDFSEDRPKYWPGQTANQFKLIKKGKDWALVREGTGTAWEESRYDWSDPRYVYSEVKRSNFLNPGTRWEFRIKKKLGGCHIDAVLERDFRGPQGLFVEALTRLPGAGRVFPRILNQTLRILERETKK